MEKLKNVIKELIEDDVNDALSEVNLEYYINSKRIKQAIEVAIRDYMAHRIVDLLQEKIIKELKKYDPQIDTEIQNLIFDEISKHIKI